MTLHKEPMNLFSVVMNIIDRIGHVNPQIGIKYREMPVISIFNPKTKKI